MVKTFFSYDEQLNQLQNNKGLTISDIVYAKKMLAKISYYALINGYKNMFRHSPSGKYLRGVTFEEIVAFYYFDNELRLLFFKYILHIERQMKSLLSYHFCEKYGELQSDYLNSNNYNYKPRNQNSINYLIQCLTNAVTLPSKYSYIQHYNHVYHNVPLWVAMNAITIGNVSAMYQYCTSDIRAKISLNYESLSEVQLHQFFRIIASCRNVCAHGERLYSFRVKEAAPDMPLHEKLKIPKKKDEYIFGKKDLFAVVLGFRYMLDNEDFKSFKTHFIHLINITLKKCPHLSRDQLFSKMGFPFNWEKVTHLKK